MIPGSSLAFLPGNKKCFLIMAPWRHDILTYMFYFKISKFILFDTMKNVLSFILRLSCFLLVHILLFPVTCTKWLKCSRCDYVIFALVDWVCDTTISNELKICPASEKEGEKIACVS